MNKLYVDPERKSGSQSEKPDYRISGKNILFDGYQRFGLSEDGSIRLGKQDHKKKYGIIRPYLKAMVKKSESIIDLGCSAGVMGFQAYLDGFRNVMFVDHDQEYLELVRHGLAHLRAEEPKTVQSKVQDLDEAADVLFVFAIIHWLYSCTEDFGSLERIVAALAHRCRNSMFIEWVGPECKDIKEFDHLNRNPELHRDEYTREKFVEALMAHFPHVAKAGSVRRGREIWIASCRPVTRDRLVAVTERMSYLRWSVATRVARRTGLSDW